MTHFTEKDLQYLGTRELIELILEYQEKLDELLKISKELVR
jgi:hypothetical protein